ncbi:MAG: GNAT family N-acetyltransferase [Candidatus Lokiarchaeota archaeon]|nr:GNAT family N-acetyltransferase [Candidatus Lokiarchaeota archaeon]
MQILKKLRIKKLHRKHATEYNVKHFSRLVTRAWREDPLIKGFIPNAKERRHFLYAYKKFLVTLGFLKGEIYTTDDMNGVAVWYPSTNSDFDLKDLIKADIGDMIRNTNLLLLLKLLRMNKLTGRMHKKHAPFPHWYLSQIAVDPNTQNSGLGSLLLKHKFNNPQKWPIYLDCSNERARKFYEKHGFKMVDSAKLDKKHILYAMIRHPENA